MTPWDTAGRIRRNLRTIRDVWAATITLLADRGMQDPVTGTTTPSLISAHVLDLRHDCHKDLRFYTMLILEQVNGGTISTKVNTLDINQLTQFIDTWALLFAEQMPDDADQAATDLNKHADQLRSLVRGDQTHRYQVGHCPELTMVGDPGTEELKPCTGALWATMRSTDTMLPKSVVCDASPVHVWQPWQWASLGRRLEKAAEERAKGEAVPSHNGAGGVPA